MGRVYSGAFAYADDLTLLAPSVGALKKMISVCIRYAADLILLLMLKRVNYF